MTRRRSGTPIHGWIVLDKPAGITSATAVARVRHALGAAKAGHAGTLDPAASGVLPIALGEATKTVEHAMNGAKEYRFTIRWGQARTTDDAEGEVTAESVLRPSAAEIRAALAEFVGRIMQVPPAFSAIKVQGRRAYDLARRNAPPVLPPREVNVHGLELLAVPDADHAEFHVRCGKGFYVRSLARDLGQRLETFGHIAALRRTAVGPFREANAIALAHLATIGHSLVHTAYLLPVEAALDDIPALVLTEREATCIRQGQALRLTRGRGPPFIEFEDFNEGDVVCATTAGRVVALVRYVAGEIRPMRVLNL